MRPEKLSAATLAPRIARTTAHRSAAMPYA